MTTYYNFTPSLVAPFQFQPTLDGQIYSCLVKWNLPGQRWYIECYDTSGNLVFNKPMVGSPIGTDINIASPYFQASSIVFRAPNNQIEVTP